MQKVIVVSYIEQVFGTSVNDEAKAKRGYRFGDLIIQQLKSVTLIFRLNCIKRLFIRWYTLFKNIGERLKGAILCSVNHCLRVAYLGWV